MLTTGPFIFINIESAAQLTTKLNSIPKFVRDVDSEKRYRLIGIGRYRAGHYTALCLTNNDQWLEIDDLTDAVPPTVIDANITVTPHLCIFKKI